MSLHTGNFEKQKSLLDLIEGEMKVAMNDLKKEKKIDVNLNFEEFKNLDNLFEFKNYFTECLNKYIYFTDYKFNLYSMGNLIFTNCKADSFINSCNLFQNFFYYARLNTFFLIKNTLLI